MIVDLVDGTITRIIERGDATSVEVTIANGKPLIRTVPNITFARLGYVVASSVCANLDSFGNLQGVRTPSESA